MFLDITPYIRFEGNGRNAQVTFSLLEEFAGPAQGLRGDLPLSAPDPSLVSNAASTKSLAFWRIANGMVPVSPIGTTGSLPRIDATGRT